MKILLVLLFVVSIFFAYDRPSLTTFLLTGSTIYAAFLIHIRSKTWEACRNLKVVDVMIPKASLTLLSHSLVLSKALEITSRSFQPVFPVMHGDVVLGLLYRDRFLSSLSSASQDGYVSDYADRTLDTVRPGDLIQDLLGDQRLTSAKVLLVIDELGNLAGLLALDIVIEFVFVDKLFNSSKSKEVHDEFLL